MSERIARLRQRLEEPLLVLAPPNVRYLCGLESTNAGLLVGPEETRLFTDFRYAEAARGVEGVVFAETKRNLAVDLAERLSGRIGFEPDALSYAQYETLAGGGLELVPRRGLVEGLRALKDEEELDAIRRASAITTEAYERLTEERFQGRTERELAWRLEQLFHELGADGPAFPSIVASGPNAALPHARPGERSVQRGDTVLVDAGAKLDGYCSDCTRTFAAGPLSGELREAYDACVEGQLAGLEAVRPRVTGAEADAAARSAIVEAGFGEAFGHGLGHGVGLLVHEAPRLSAESTDTLAATNVVTVEPGVYFPGSGGVRIEDLVVVREEGAEVLTTFTKELVEVE